jgi:queuosine precursor transporter
MNETIFFLHIIFIALFTFGSLRIGKEALVTWVCVQAILANFFVIKQISLFGCTVTASDVFAVGGILGLNLLQEYFGREASKKAAWTCFYFMLFFAAMSQIHLWYAPSVFDTTHNAFETILKPAPRLLLASLFVFCIVQQLDIRFFGILKNKLHSSPFALRRLLSISLSQLIDTTLFTFLGLYGLVASLIDVLFVSFFIKVIVILSMSPLTILAKRFIRKTEDPA